MTDKKNEKHIKDMAKVIEQQRKLSADLLKVQGDQNKMAKIMDQMQKLMKTQADAASAVVRNMK